MWPQFVYILKVCWIRDFFFFWIKEHSVFKVGYIFVNQKTLISSKKKVRTNLVFVSTLNCSPPSWIYLLSKRSSYFAIKEEVPISTCQWLRCSRPCYWMVFLCVSVLFASTTTQFNSQIKNGLIFSLSSARQHDLLDIIVCKINSFTYILRVTHCSM